MIVKKQIEKEILKRGDSEDTFTLSLIHALIKIESCRMYFIKKIFILISIQMEKQFNSLSSI